MKKIVNACILLYALLSLARAQEIKAWKTVQLGLYQNTDEVRETYRYNRKYVEYNEAADSILSQGPIAFETKPKTVQVVMICGADLGFDKEVSYDTLCQAARKKGLVPCSAETVLQLRLVYDDQPLGDWQYVVMDPIEYDNGESLSARSILALVNTDKYSNAIVACDPLNKKMFSPQRRFIFQKLSPAP